MKIFITGSSGMVGMNLIENNEISKHEILKTSSSTLNLLNYNDVNNYLTKNMPDLIIHCAGKVGGIHANMSDQYGFFSENAIMGINIVTAAKEIGIKKILNISSSCAYPRDYKNPLKEEYTLKGELEPTNEGYALAKLSILKMCEYISKEYPDLKYKTIVPCNIYGRYDKFGENNSHMIPAVIKKIHHAKENNLSSLEIWGDGLARREFMYAGDLANCIAKIINNFDSLPNLMNVGLGYDYTINEYYEKIKQVIGYKGEFTHNLDKPVGMKQKLLDITKQKNWGWQPSISLNEGLKMCYKFYLKEYENVKI